MMQPTDATPMTIFRTPPRREQQLQQLQSAKTPSSSTRRLFPPIPSEDFLSPADTFDTYLTNPTFDSTDDAKSTKICIENKTTTNTTTTPSSNNNPGTSGIGYFRSNPKTSLSFFVLLLFFAASSSAALLGWFQRAHLGKQIKAFEEQVESLQNEIKLLSQEIENLSDEVDRLEDENDRFEMLNDKLNNTVSKFESTTTELNATVAELGETASRLNQTNLDLSKEVLKLETQNYHYALLNTHLNATALHLSGEIRTLEQALMQMSRENQMLSNLTLSLEGTLEHLGDYTLEQNETLTELRLALASFTLENQRLEELNYELFASVSFLNQTSIGLDQTMQEITTFLSDQISFNQMLLLGTIENTYLQRIDNWDCDYREYFRDETYGRDFYAPIENATLALEYVDDRVMSELCLNITDFERFLSEVEYADVELTSHRLIRGVTIYARKALQIFYFPPSLSEDDGTGNHEQDNEFGEHSTGLTLLEWNAASYKCENLPTMFSWWS